MYIVVNGRIADDRIRYQDHEQSSFTPAGSRSRITRRKPLPAQAMKLGAVSLFVNDLSAAKAFYTQLMGLPLQRDGSERGYCVFDADAVELIVEAVPGDAPSEDRAVVARFSGLSFHLDDIDSEHHRPTALGLPFPDVPAQQSWGGCLSTFMDPSGNQLQLAQSAR